MKTSKHIGILYILCSAFCFSCMNLFVRLSGDLPSIQKSFFRNLIAFLFALLIIKKEKVSLHITFRINNRQLPPDTLAAKSIIVPLLLRSIAGTIGVLCNFYTVDHLPIADASMLNKLSPFFALIFSFLILKEKVTLYHTVCIAIAFLGSLFVIKPSVSLFQNPSSLIGFLGGLTAGLAYTFVRVAGQRGVKGPIIVAFFSGFSCLVTLPNLLLNYAPMSTKQLVILLLAGLSAAGGQFAITAAYTHAPAREISIYDYSQIIFSMLLGLAVLGELPDKYSFIGYVIIIGASVVMFLLNNGYLKHTKNIIKN